MSNAILEELRKRDVEAGRGTINDIGEYVPNEKRKKGKEWGGWDDESVYMPKGGTAAKAQKRIDKQKSPKYKMAQKAIADAAKGARETRDVGADISRARQGKGRGMPDEIERRQKALRSKYAPQTGTRSDEEKGFFSGIYDKTVGEYQRGRDEKERLKEETKAAMAAEPDPFVKKEIARKGHAEYMKIASTEGQGERGRERMGAEAFVAQRKRDKEKYGRMEQHAGYRDREIRDKEVGGGGNTGLDAEAGRLKDARVRQESIEREEGPQIASGAGDELQETGFLQKNLRDLPLVGGMFGENERDMSGDGQVAEEAYSKLGAGGRMQKAPWEVQKEEERQKRLEEQAKLATPKPGGLRESIRETSEAGREEAESQFARSQQPTIEDDPRLSGKGPEFEREYEPDEFTQDQARDAISTLKPDEGDAVVDEIKAKKGQGPEWLEAKEALRDSKGRPRYVRYEGSGLVIDMSMLEKDIDRNHFFKNVLPNVAPENRTAVMAEKGYFPEGDLSVAQKKSAKEIKELEILNLRANALKLEAEKQKDSVPADKQMLYKETMTGFRQAVKDKDWDSASMFASELRGIGLPLKDFDPVALEAASNQRLLGKEPHMLKIASRHGIMVGGKPSLTPFYNQQKELTHKLTFLGKDGQASSAGLSGVVTIEAGKHSGTTVTFGEILKREGIETWDKVSARIAEIQAGGAANQVSINLAKAMGVEKLEDVSKEAYLHYAKQLAHDKISRTVWGDAYDEIKQGGKAARTAKEKAAQDAFDPSKETNPESSSISDEYKPTDWVKKQGTPASRAAAKVKAAEKKKAGKAKAFRTEKENDKRMKKGSGRQQVEMSMAEKETAYMKEGKKKIDELVAGRVNPRSRIKKAVAGHPRFNSTEDAIKFYKNDPKGQKLLKKMSLAFRHFMKQQ